MDEKTRELLNRIQLFMDNVLERHADKRIYWLPDDVKGSLKKYRNALRELLEKPDEGREILAQVIDYWSDGEISHLPVELKDRIHKFTSSAQETPKVQ